MIQLSALSKSFGDRVLLEAVNWQIDDRERVGLSGPNGAGKTTLLKMLAGLDEPDGGLVVKPSGLTIGYLPQDGLVHTGRTLREEAGLAFKSLLDTRPDIEMVFGSRVNLLGRNVHRRLARHYAGRVFATAAAAVLGVGIYDTQCGAKLFRVSSGFVERLKEPFIGGWIFDVEMIAREVRARRSSSLPPVSKIIYEYPLMEWRDVAGSKIKPTDWVKVAVNLGRIYAKYLW